MKRHFISFLILILSAQFISFAGIVPIEKARQTAAAFFKAAEVSTRAANPADFKLLGTFPESKTRSVDEAPAIYVFERTSGGYAIVSADEVARPVLAYSLNAPFPSWDEIPDNMMAMIRWYADIIGFARSKQWEPFPETRGDAGLDPANTVQLNTAQWNQYAPFNNLVKEINGEKPPIGCVATAIAIVMKYHRWPNQGTGILPAYDYRRNGGKYHVDGVTLGHTYNWDLMPDNYLNCSNEEADQLARLLYDVAVMCKMEFYPGGSGSGSDTVLRLIEYFGYDKSMLFNERVLYRVTEWENLIKKDIDNGLPVFYGGFSDGGHAFVIDGYNGRYFSLNYGWGGTTKYLPGHDNSSIWKYFFTLSPIEGHEEDLLVYNESQNAVFHIMPERGNAAGLDALNSQQDLFVPYDFRKGMSFSLHSTISNRSQREITRKFRYVLFDSKGNAKQLISPEEELTVTNEKNKLYEGKCQINVEIEEGDRLCLAALEDDSKTWTPITTLRSCQVVFTRQPLAEVVEIGYDKGFKHPYYNENFFFKDLTLYMRLYKDLCWKLSRKSDGKILITNDKLTSIYDRSDSSVYGNMVDRWDLDNDMAEIRIGLRSGSYVIHFLNPATGETMDLDLEI